MSFNKRHLDEKTIRIYAQEEFEFFEDYLTKCDSYIVAPGWAEEIHNKFITASPSEKKEIHTQIKNEPL